MKNFPKKIFVTIEEPSSGRSYLEVCTSYPSLNEEQRVAIYELKEVKVLKIKKSLE